MKCVINIASVSVFDVFVCIYVSVCLCVCVERLPHFHSIPPHRNCMLFFFLLRSTCLTSVQIGLKWTITVHDPHKHTNTRKIFYFFFHLVSNIILTIHSTRLFVPLIILFLFLLLLGFPLLSASK